MMESEVVRSLFSNLKRKAVSRNLLPSFLTCALAWQTGCTVVTASILPVKTGKTVRAEGRRRAVDSSSRADVRLLDAEVGSDGIRLKVAEVPQCGVEQEWKTIQPRTLNGKTAFWVAFAAEGVGAGSMAAWLATDPTFEDPDTGEVEPVSTAAWAVPATLVGSMITGAIIAGVRSRDRTQRSKTEEMIECGDPKPAAGSLTVTLGEGQAKEIVAADGFATITPPILGAAVVDADWFNPANEDAPIEITIAAAGKEIRTVRVEPTLISAHGESWVCRAAEVEPVAVASDPQRWNRNVGAGCAAVEEGTCDSVGRIVRDAMRVGPRQSFDSLAALVDRCGSREDCENLGEVGADLVAGADADVGEVLESYTDACGSGTSSLSNAIVSSMGSRVGQAFATSDPEAAFIKLNVALEAMPKALEEAARAKVVVAIERASIEPEDEPDAGDEAYWRGVQRGLAVLVGQQHGQVKAAAKAAKVSKVRYAKQEAHRQAVATAAARKEAKEEALWRGQRAVVEALEHTDAWYFVGLFEAIELRQVKLNERVLGAIVDDIYRRTKVDGPELKKLRRAFGQEAWDAGVAEYCGQWEEGQQLVLRFRVYGLQIEMSPRRCAKRVNQWAG